MLSDLLIQPLDEGNNFFEERIDLVGASPILEAANNISFDLLSEKKRAIGTRYDHAVRIFIGLINAADKPLQEEFLAAALLHDVFDSKDNTLENDALRSILTLENGDYILGILLATEEYEKQAEQWRAHILESMELSNEGTESSDLLDGLLSKCATEDNSVKDLKVELANCLTSKGADNIDKKISNELWNFRSPIIDINQTVEILEQLDIEALIIKCFEVIDNLKFPNPRNKIAGFRDAQEMISFYAPLIELCGFKSVATEVYGTALEYLNTRGELGETKDPKTRSLMSKYNEVNKGITSSDIYERIVDAINIQDLAIDDEEGVIIKSRPNKGVKTLGSFLEKCRLGEIDRSLEMCPDFMGLRLCLPPNNFEVDSDETFLDIFRIITERLETSLAHQIYPGNTRGDASIEVTFGDNAARQQSVELADSVVQADIKPTRKSGYNAGHFYYTLIIKEREVGLEIQVTDTLSEEENSAGKASHVIYKTGQSYGPFGVSKRMFDNVEEDDPRFGNIQETYNNEVAQIIKSIGSIRHRASAFRLRENIQLTRYTSQLVSELVKGI